MDTTSSSTTASLHPSRTGSSSAGASSSGSPMMMTTYSGSGSPMASTAAAHAAALATLRSARPQDLLYRTSSSAYGSRPSVEMVGGALQLVMTDACVHGLGRIQQVGLS
jgi:hypothetical protein